MPRDFRALVAIPRTQTALANSILHSSIPIYTLFIPVFSSISGGPKLDDVISRKSLTVIARDHLNNWKTLGPFLDLTRQQETAIAYSSPDFGLQKRECLEVWKEKRGKEATYRALISAAEEAGDQLLADNIRDMLEK